MSSEYTDRIEHYPSGVHIYSTDDGLVSITGLGNPYRGDPIPGMDITFNPATNELIVSNRFGLTSQGELTELPEVATQTYKLDFGKESGTDSASLFTSSDPDPETDHEVGIFRNLQSDNGTMEATIFDRGRISQGAVALQHTNPETGDVTLIGLDENTVHVALISANGGVQQATAELTGGIFPDNDFRYQPAPSMGPAGP